MLKIFIDGKHFQDQMRNLEVREGQEFHLRLVKIDHDKLGKWDIYFETLPAEVEKPVEPTSEPEFISDSWLNRAV